MGLHPPGLLVAPVNPRRAVRDRRVRDLPADRAGAQFCAILRNSAQFRAILSRRICPPTEQYIAKKGGVWSRLAAPRVKHWAQLTADTLFAALLISRQADPYWLTPAANASTAEDDTDARGLFDIGRYGCYARGVGQCADALAVVVLVWAFFALMAIIKKLGTHWDASLGRGAFTRTSPIAHTSHA